MNTFLIGKRDIAQGEVPFIIEEGQANLGRHPVALDMIQAAGRAGADGIEFQLANADDFYVRSHPGYDIYKSREFTSEQIVYLAQAAGEAGLGFIACAFSPRLVRLLSQAGCTAFNVNASDLTNPEMLDAVCESSRPFFLSIPLATLDEIDWAVARVRDHGANTFALLLGQHIMATSSGGVPAEATCLGAIGMLRSRYGVPVGFIDHTAYQWMPAAAVAAGAAVVTKHMAISRAERGPDWHICLEPGEMAEAVRMARGVTSSIRTLDKIVAPGELPDRKVMRRSIVARHSLPVGHRIARDELAFKRPGNGIEPRFVDRVVGSVTARPISPDEPFGWDALVSA